GSGGVNATSGLIVDRDVALDGTERGTAWFSSDRTYRYLLTRRWDVLRPVMGFIMLNPSTADAFRPDPTITRCAGFADREGCGGIDVVNLFALRATDPRKLAGHPDPAGPANDDFLADLARLAEGPVVAAWGAHAAAGARARAVAELFARLGVPLRCLGTTKAGAPRHPLYVRGDAPLTGWPVTRSEVAA
ncbi:MAG TPA: DUF1643 domain-containing protein, partial [Streptosporangiaceae bacterium]|nr:DUF1643 domain-containing protein [Streptosporangiaceae bacterium]